MSNENRMSRRSFITGAAGAGICAVAGSGVALADEAGEQASSANPSWLGEEPQIDESQIVETVEADVVVVGAGNGGSMCAAAAAEAGAKVAVVEAQSQDIMSYYGLCDIASVNSEYALSRGAKQIKKSAMISELQRRSHNRTNPALIKQWVDNSGEMVDWLLSRAPQEVLDTVLVENIDTNVDYFNLGQEISGFRAWNGTVQVNYSGVAPVLIEEAEQGGSKWYWGHKGVKLEVEEYDEPGKETFTAEDGTVTEQDCTVTRRRVTGVIAKNEDGDYVRFVGSKGVVLACGGYGGNAEMFAALQDETRSLFESHGLSTDDIHSLFGRDGSGIKMGLWAGGTLDPSTRCIIAPGVLFESDHYASNVLRWASGYAIAGNQGTANESGSGVSQNPWGAPFVCLDESGHRFMDEMLLGIFGQMNRVERRKPGKYFFIFDNQYKELISRQAPEHYSEPVGVAGSIDYDAVFQSWIDRGAEGCEVDEGGTPCAWAANSLDELYTYMGFDDEMKSEVQAEIEKYNGYCLQGDDEDFGRDPKLLMEIAEPPFFGMYSVVEKPSTGILTLNGLNIGDHQEVLDKNYNPIEGLYATGNNSGGRFATEYSTPMAGLTIGMAMTLGRVLGQQLAAK